MITISDKVRIILQKMQGSSPIADNLLGLADGVVTLPINPDYPNYIDLAKGDPEKISYLSFSRQSSMRDEDNPWENSKRYKIRAGSFVNKMYPKGTFDGRTIEYFSDAYTSLYLSNFTTEREKMERPKKYSIKVVEKDEIVKYYAESRMESVSGTLAKSCMRHDNLGEHLSLYTRNSEICKMLVIVDNNDRLLARAILWNLPEHKVMDRIYTVNTSNYPDKVLINEMIQYALDNGYIFKTNQNWNDSLHFNSGDKSKFVTEISFKLPFNNLKSFPYLDTFRFYNNKTKELSNFLVDENVYDDDVYTLCKSDGTYLPKSYVALDSRTNVYQKRGMHKSANMRYISYLRVWTTEESHWSPLYATFILGKHAQSSDLGVIFKPQYAKFIADLEPKNAMEAEEPNFSETVARDSSFMYKINPDTYRPTKRTTAESIARALSRNNLNSTAQPLESLRNMYGNIVTNGGRKVVINPVDGSIRTMVEPDGDAIVPELDREVIDSFLEMDIRPQGEQGEANLNGLAEE